jgi:hypothetical protein
MWMQKVRMGVLLALSLVVVGTGASLIGYRVLASEPGPSEATATTSAERSAPAPDEETQIAELAKARLAAAREVYEALNAAFQSGRGTRDELLLWSPHLLEAELDAATTKAERIKARESHLKRMEEYEKLMLARAAVSRAGSRDFAEAKLLRIEAELRLAQEKRSGKAGPR